MFRMRSFFALCAAVLLGFFLSYAAGASAFDMLVGGFVVASIGVGLFELWAPIKAVSRAVFAAFWRSRFAALAFAAYTALMHTLRRLFGGWRQEVRSAPAHSWRSCPST